jgi:type II secretory pathway pseudopilin PulG
MNAPQREAGFAFIETVIAAAIVATMLGVTLQTITDDARRARAVEERRHAALVAQSVLASAGVLLEGADGETRGVSGGMRWRVDVRPYGAAARDASGRLDLVTVSVGPANHAGDLLALRTLRVGR